LSLTDINKAREPTWVPCPIQEYSDEEHLIMPGTRENLQYVSDKSMVNEFRNGQFVRESDTNVFTIQWLKKHWKGWRGTVRPEGEGGGRYRGVGIVHEDGIVEDPAEFTEKNWLIIANIRGQTFLLWLQEASRQLAAKAQQEREEQRESFRSETETQVGLSGAEV
jgi:hypothetical protein